MQNPIKTKIADVKFSVRRLEQECDRQGFESSRKLLEQARLVLEQAEYHADRPQREPKQE